MNDSGVPRLALVVGSQCAVQQPLSFLPDLAVELHTLLMDPESGACTSALPGDSGNGLLLDPTRDETLDALRTAFATANDQNATLIVALLGHGISKIGDFYFLSSDSSGTGDPDKDVFLSHRLKQLVADNADMSGLIVWLDTCFSGVAAQQATDWQQVGLEQNFRRYEILSATGADAAYRVW